MTVGLPTYLDAVPPVPAPRRPSPSPPQTVTSADPSTRRARLLLGWAALVLLAGQGWAAREAYRATVAAEEAEVLAVARATASALEHLLSVAERSTGSLARRHGRALLSPEGCGTGMPPLGAAFPFFANFLVVNAEGAMVCSALPSGEPVNVADRAWFQRLRDVRAFAVGEPVTGRVSGAWVVVMGSPILDEDGTFLGAVAGSVELLRLEEVLLGRVPDPSELVTITTDEGVVVARSADAESWVGRPLPTGTVEVERRGERLVVTRAEDASGTARVWGRVDLTSIGWRVYTGVPASRVRAPARAELLRHGMVALVLLGVLLLAGWRLGGGPSPAGAGAAAAPRVD